MSTTDFGALHSNVQIRFWTIGGKPSATAWQKREAHGASRGEKCAITQSPVRTDRIPSDENYLSPLRGSESPHANPRLTPWAIFCRCSAASCRRFENGFGLSTP